MGSNIDAETNLRASADLIRREWPSVRFSSVWQTKAMEVTTQADFLNAVAVFDTTDSPEFIHGKLQGIERALKKSPPFRFGPRTIDLDILLYGEQIIQTSDLTVPHPKLHQRRFVLEPLIELGGGEMVHPIQQKRLNDFLPHIIDQECKRTQRLEL